MHDEIFGRLPSRAIVIFGGSGAGALAAQSVTALAASGADIKLVGYLNDRLPAGTLVSGAPVLGPFSAWRDLPQTVLFLAPLHKAKEMSTRAGIVRDLGIPEERWTTVIDPRSAVASDAVIGLGSFVGAFASVGPNATVGAHTVIRGGAHVSHDCSLGDFVFVGWNAVICGYARAHFGVYIAPNATVNESCQLGQFSVVGLGSVVTSNVPDFAVVHGNPARRVDRYENGVVEEKRYPQAMRQTARVPPRS